MADSSSNDDKLFAQVVEEINIGHYDIGLWAKCFHLSNGDQDKAYAKYLGERVEKLKELDKVRKEISVKAERAPEQERPSLPPKDGGSTNSQNTALDGIRPQENLMLYDSDSIEAMAFAGHPWAQFEMSRRFASGTTYTKNLKISFMWLCISEKNNLPLSAVSIKRFLHLWGFSKAEKSQGQKMAEEFLLINPGLLESNPHERKIKDLIKISGNYLRYLEDQDVKSDFQPEPKKRSLFNLGKKLKDPSQLSSKAPEKKKWDPSKEKGRIGGRKQAGAGKGGRGSDNFNYPEEAAAFQAAMGAHASKKAALKKKITIVLIILIASITLIALY